MCVPLPAGCGSDRAAASMSSSKFSDVVRPMVRCHGGTFDMVCTTMHRSTCVLIDDGVFSVCMTTFHYELSGMSAILFMALVKRGSMSEGSCSMSEGRTRLAMQVYTLIVQI